MRHWTEFTGRPNRVNRDRPRVSINKKGVILLNRHAHKLMKSPERVKLLYDAHHQAIGLQPVKGPTPNGFPVRARDKYENRSIAASPFCKHFGINIERTMLFNDVDLDRTGVLVLSLNRTTVIGRGGY